MALRKRMERGGGGGAHTHTGRREIKGRVLQGHREEEERKRRGGGLSDGGAELKASWKIYRCHLWASLCRQH